MKDTPTIQILDWAQPPPVKSRPKIRLTVLASGLLAFVVASGLAIRGFPQGEISGRNSMLSELELALREDLSLIRQFLCRRSGANNAT